MSRSDRIFRRLLRLFPAEFRADFGDDMAETFRDHREAMVNRGSRSAFALGLGPIQVKSGLNQPLDVTGRLTRLRSTRSKRPPSRE